MQLATRMSRLGTETAFEVLVRARALEAQGKDVIHLEVGEPEYELNTLIRAVKRMPCTFTPSNQ